MGLLDNTEVFALLAIVAVSISIIALLRIYACMCSRYDRQEDAMHGKTVIITGANTGLGKATATDLARRGSRIILACRDIDKGETARKEICQETGSDIVVCKKLDLASFESIREFANDVTKAESTIDVLVNNAGVMMCPPTLTKDGLEYHVGVNHFGHFLLTELLLDKLKASSPSRIVNVASFSYIVGKINFDDLKSVQSYNRIKAYCQSKLANVLHSNELAKRLKGSGVTANCLHPGVVDTDIFRHLPLANSALRHFITYPMRTFFMKTPHQGAQTTIKLCVDPSLENVTGKYFVDCKEQKLASHACDEAASEQLWTISQTLTRSNEMH